MALEGLEGRPGSSPEALKSEFPYLKFGTDLKKHNCFTGDVQRWDGAGGEVVGGLPWDLVFL